MPAVSAWRVLSATLARLPKRGHDGTHTPQASNEFLQEEGINPEARAIQEKESL